MKQIAEIQDLFAKFIEQESFSGTPRELYEPIDYTLRQQGKRIRPTLCLLSCDLFGGALQDALNPALATEVFHNFTLIHDDIMDQAPIRRGKETVYKKWNQNIAILSGDVMLTKAFHYALKTNEKCAPKILEALCEVSIEICEGQQFDLNFENMEQVSIPQYIEMIRLKTAVLLGTALKMGALIAQADTDSIKKIYDFGIALGLAFQLQDDLLDCYGDVKVFGKAIGGDIMENKKTFLFLKALEESKTDDKQTLTKIFNGTLAFDKPQQKINAVLALYHKYQIKEKTEILMSDYYNRSKEILQSIAVADEKKNILRAYVENLYTRNK